MSLMYISCNKKKKNKKKPKHFVIVVETEKLICVKITIIDIDIGVKSLLSGQYYSRITFFCQISAMIVVCFTYIYCIYRSDKKGNELII